MITFEKLNKNLSALQKALPKKPLKYTSDFPKTIEESLTKYANTRTVNLLGINVYHYNIHGWPLPLYVDHANICVGFRNNLHYRIWRYNVNKSYRQLFPLKKIKKLTVWNIKIPVWSWAGIPIQRNIHLKDAVNLSVIELFHANKKLVEKKFYTHPYLKDKEKIIQDIFFSYRKKKWASCIYTLFPLLDSVARQVLNTENLKKDMQSICKLFAQIGISADETDVLMAHTNAVMVSNKIREKEIPEASGKALMEKGYSYKLNLIGPALSSFLYFSNRYYGYYKADNDNGDPLNRHAIIHGSYNNFSTRENVVRLFTYLYLILELEPILLILLRED